LNASSTPVLQVNTGGIYADNAPFVPNTLYGIKGTTGADNANAGSVGEFQSATLSSGSAITLTSGVTSNVVTLTLTAGDWDVWGELAWQAGSATTSGVMSGGTTTTSLGTPTAASGGYDYYQFSSGTFPSSGKMIVPVGINRINVNSSTIVYLVTSVNFSGGVMQSWGSIFARRVR
jgi:hypothetical protein